MDLNGRMEKLMNYKGISAPPVTPTYQDGTVNYEAIGKFVDHLVQTGVNGVFVSGTTGEFTSLSMSERKMIAEAWLKFGKDKLDMIIIQCGSSCMDETKEMVRHAKENGADAVACISPSFLKPMNEEYLSDYLEEVASEAPNTPFMYYHLPSFTGVKVDMSKLMSLCYEKIETFAGLKCSSENMYEMIVPLKFKPKPLKVFYGFDWQFLGGLAMGADCAVCTSFNFIGNKFVEITKAYKNGNMKEAQSIQHKIALDFNPFCSKYHGVAFAKIATTLISGIDMGQPRRPLHQFSEKQIKEIKAFLTKEGYLKK
ncbi:N-acetylneuraminate lyase-like [Clytia hemisphaerica]|uniref:N-acetylneuraminate lyase n=1 Tax=Clytia hemisphaerica TaxID=252671 RepID=A0A7M6DN52_9CNID